MKNKHSARILRRLVTLMLALVITAASMLPATEQTVAAASNTTLLTKYLKYYKAGNYAKAGKYLKKMNNKKKDTSLKKMSAAQKKAYRKVVKKYSKNISDPNRYSQKYMWGYYLADLNKDKRAELLIQYGSCEADVRTYVYTYTKKKAKKIGWMYSGHTSYVAYPGKGVLAVWGHMGYCSVSLVKMKNKKLTEKSYGDQKIESADETYCIPTNFLDNHVRYDANYTASVDYKDLK